jgi:hypothetical protein
MRAERGGPGETPLNEEYSKILAKDVNFSTDQSVKNT